MIRAVLLSTMLASAAMAEGFTAYDDLDETSAAAVDRIYECMDEAYNSSFDGYMHCIGAIHFSCTQHDDFLGAFGSKTCAEAATFSWTYVTEDLLRGESNGVDDAVAYQLWKAWQAEQCKETFAVSLPFDDDTAEQVMRCRAELAALQALRMFAARMT